MVLDGPVALQAFSPGPALALPRQLVAPDAHGSAHVAIARLTAHMAASRQVEEALDAAVTLLAGDEPLAGALPAELVAKVE